MRNKSGAIDLYRLYESKGITLATVITTLELHKGANLSEMSNLNLEKVRVVLSLFDILPFSQDVCETFGHFSADLKLKGIPIGDFDEVIAAMVLCHDRVLITRDNQFSKVPDLEIINY
ncbi:type II toxin-antitoxin system VapC family toxin [Methanoplanus endosymbiosus]|uniref:Type II toxin-antitoxin system VapC family toxin n=1 Tax=Methanoplanus endosymbiosus TaxID=33865 RepID=A0A9E7PRI7_9EURY|nr:type II toxin-antitoxin system VapC family toxin [Methanoplanus endosymbiosus]UUX93711.1 type II toxin-antitoxin system VapC family toxin [Methanoplanus endosymbiosus]